MAHIVQKVEHSLDPIQAGRVWMLYGGVFLVEQAGLVVPFVGFVTIGALIGIAHFQNGAHFPLIGIVPLVPQFWVYGSPSPSLSKGHHGIVTDTKEQGHPVVELLAWSPIRYGIAMGEHGFQVSGSIGGGVSVLAHPIQAFRFCPGQYYGL